LNRTERHKLGNGRQILVLATAYAFGRYFIEFLRGDAERGFWGPLSVPQWFCALALFVSVILLTLLSLRKTGATQQTQIALIPLASRRPSRTPETSGPSAHKHA
jgi:prolipoprotein diacylglyceryltransferase